MAEITYCPNCNQSVAPQNKGGSGTTGVVLLIIGIILMFVVWPVGILLLIAAGICILVAIIEGVVNLASGKVGAYPICKTTLYKGKKE